MLPQRLQVSFTKLLAELHIGNRSVSSHLREDSGVGIAKLQGQEHSRLQDQLEQRQDGRKEQQEVSLEEWDNPRIKIMSGMSFMMSQRATPKDTMAYLLLWKP